jgi:prepilin-type N-terminal cleavage/methylation domain-containing protein
MVYKRATSTAGFTLIEIIVTFVLIALLTTWLFGRYHSTDSTSLIPQANILITHMRYAQARAMSTSSSWGIQYDDTPGAFHYSLFRELPENRAVLPGEDSEWVELGEMDITVAEGSFTLSFDSWGRPACTGCSSGGNRTFSLTLSKPDSSSGTLTIVQNTGFIQWQ